MTISERTVRVATSAGVFVLLVALVGLGTLLAQIGKLGRSAETVSLVRGSSPSPELSALRGRVSALRSALDTIQREEGRLRMAAGIPGADTTTVLRRFFPRLPSLLGGRRGQEGGRAGQPRAPAAQSRVPLDSAGIRGAAATAAATADSLTSFAAGTLERFRRLATESGIQGDSIETLSFHPESLLVAIAGGTTSVSIVDGAAEWRAARPAGIALGMNAVVSGLVRPDTITWIVEFGGPAGLRAQLRTPGRLLVRQGERVVADQIVAILDGSRAAAPVRFELRRAGVLLDPLTLRPAVRRR